MIEAGGDTDLLRESFGAEHRCDLGTHPLEVDQAVVLQVPGLLQLRWKIWQVIRRGRSAKMGQAD
jgi:hypothetical protein